MAYVEILLNQGKTALIDCIDAELVLRYNWHFSDTGYAVWRSAQNGKKQTIRMHRLINNTPDGMVTDHINHNRLDNRRENLRTVTQAENMRNLTDQGKGYWLHKQNGNWAVEICDKSYGSYETEEIAQEIVALVRAGETIEQPEPTECIHGHSLADAYEYGGRKTCRTCSSNRAKAYFKRKYVPNPKKLVTVCPRGHDKTITMTKNHDCSECIKIRGKSKRRITP